MYNSDIPPRSELPTTKHLLHSTLVAAVVAVALLITTVLPAEYGIDPTGIGRMIGLTEMGEIKTQLEEEAEADRVRGAAPASNSSSRSDLLQRVFAVLFVSPAAAHDGGHQNRNSAGMPPMMDDGTTKKATGRADEISVTLKPGQGAEVKLVMKKGAKANYSWSVEGGVVNFDLHGDGPGRKSKSYKRGRADQPPLCGPV